MLLLKKLHHIIDGNIETNKLSKHYNIFSSTLIIISILLIILESFEELEERLSILIYTTETFVVIFFSFEYILRLITSPFQYPNKKIIAPFLFIVSFLGIIDLLSILPFYLPMFINSNLTFLRVLRLFRLMRIFKLLRYSESVRTLGKALGRIKTELISTLFITFIVLLFSANVMFIRKWKLMKQPSLKYQTLPAASIFVLRIWSPWKIYINRLMKWKSLKLKWLTIPSIRSYSLIIWSSDWCSFYLRFIFPTPYWEGFLKPCDLVIPLTFIYFGV